MLFAVDVGAKAIMRTESLIDWEASPNIVNKAFVQPSWHSDVWTIQQPRIWEKCTERVQIEGSVLLSIFIRELFARAWFGEVDNLPTELLLETVFIGWCMGRVFLSEYKIALWNLPPGLTLFTKPTVPSLFAYVTFIDNGLSLVVEEEEKFPCRVARQTTAPADSQVIFLASVVLKKWSGIIVIENPLLYYGELLLHGGKGYHGGFAR